MELCEPYFWEDPTYIVHSFKAKKVPCASHMVNRVVAVYSLTILLGLVLTCFMRSQLLYLSLGVVSTLFLLPTFLALKEIKGKKGTKEGFDVNQQFTLLAEQPKATIEYNEDAPLPFQETINEVRNPFHNITIDQYSYAPKRDPAPSLQTPQAKEEMDAFFRVQWSSDPTDVFGKTQSQRMFISQPVTSIPNDQKSYQDWLYKIPGLTCKEGNGDACYGGTNGSPMPWLNL